MIEKIKIPEDIEDIINRTHKRLSQEINYDVVAMNLSAVAVLLVEKINEIIDVINENAIAIKINAADAKAFDEMTRNNPGCIVKVIDDALKNEEPPDDAA